ncbi:hypothetical protein FQN57_000064 [Myotisia sp. PD_48]|nr:hypothetical protein FQN57_000064 [Myotisia sp. PD_48]
MVAVDDIPWPPKSPHDALMSSPSGRKKYKDMLDRRRNAQNSSPMKGLSSIKASQILDEYPLDGEEDDMEDDDDEETLQLKLAAIQARLKLKKLQQNKKKLQLSDPDGADARPANTFPKHRDQQQLASERKRKAGEMAYSEDVQVPASPIRKLGPSVTASSPKRVLLGIDKGLKADQVSLRRPRTLTQTNRWDTTAASQRTKDFKTSTALPLDSTNALGRSKSFSDRIRESRSADKERRDNARVLQRKRTTGFNIDKKELEGYHTAATQSTVQGSGLSKTYARTEADSRGHTPIRHGLLSPRKGENNATAGENIPPRTTFIRQTGEHRQNERPQEIRTFKSTTTPTLEDTGQKAPDPTKFESFSSLHLSTRILPHSFLKRTLDSKTALRIPDLLRKVKGPEFDPPDTDGDYVVFGIVASKSAPKDHKEKKDGSAKDTKDEGANSTNKYMVLTLTDLKWTIDLFLFSTAFPRYYRLSPGTLIAILNPSIMPPPPHKTATNAFSLTLHSSDDTVLEIGTAQDIGFCKAVKRDGQVCESWVDIRKTEYCDFHVETQLRKTTSSRMEVNSGPGIYTRPTSQGGNFQGRRGQNNPLGGGLKPQKGENGGRYDKATGSTFFVAPSASSSSARNDKQDYFPGRHNAAASLLDADDPFVEAGMFHRGGETKAERLRKRLADQERERGIARQLGDFKGVGAEYLRAHHYNSTEQEQKTPGTGRAVQSGTKHTPNTDDAFLGLDNLTKSAKSVQLGRIKGGLAQGKKKAENSVKKTRFITANGIREAGRDSLGRATRSMTDYDDDLDIV